MTKELIEKAFERYERTLILFFKEVCRIYGIQDQDIEIKSDIENKRIDVYWKKHPEPEKINVTIEFEVDESELERNE